jgi:hypothetical protein
MSISQFPIPNRFSCQPTIVSNTRNAKRGHNAGAKKMRKNFSVGALFEDSRLLSE